MRCVCVCVRVCLYACVIEHNFSVCVLSRTHSMYITRSAVVDNNFLFFWKVLPLTLNRCCRRHSIENTFYIEHILQRTHSIENTFYREHILYRTHSTENTLYRELYREHILERAHSIEHTFVADELMQGSVNTSVCECACLCVCVRARACVCPCVRGKECACIRLYVPVSEWVRGCVCPYIHTYYTLHLLFRGLSVCLHTHSLSCSSLCVPLSFLSCVFTHTPSCNSQHISNTLATH